MQYPVLLYIFKETNILTSWHMGRGWVKYPTRVWSIYTIYQLKMVTDKLIWIWIYIGLHSTPSFMINHRKCMLPISLLNYWEHFSQIINIGNMLKFHLSSFLSILSHLPAHSVPRHFPLKLAFEQAVITGGEQTHSDRNKEECRLEELGLTWPVQL